MGKRGHYKIRPARREDLAAVAAIERETQSPWSFSALEKELGARHGRQLVVEAPDPPLLGWCAYRTVWPEAELLKIAITEGERHKGLGSLLLEALLKELQVQEYTTLFLEVRARNKTALQFYEKHGFRQVGRRLGYYSEPTDDALILQRDIETVC